MKEVIERLNWLAYKCEDKAITPDVKDDVKYALEEIERLNNIINELENELYKFYAYEGYNDEQIKDKIKELKGSDK